ncbi:hypothetical protein [Pseudomonas helleri]|uniref:hypothetical protein n=1 Tax=Pseudomonas helleri TaxID=1608996 RepID=UPI003FD28254
MFGVTDYENKSNGAINAIVSIVISFAVIILIFGAPGVAVFAKWYYVVLGGGGVACLVAWLVIAFVLGEKFYDFFSEKISLVLMGVVFSLGAMSSSFVFIF